MAVGSSSYLPIAGQIPRANKQANEIEVFKQGVLPQKGVVYIANVAAHGNGYATMDTLENTIKEEAAKVGAELVILTNYQVSNDESVGSYGGGMFMSNQIKRPHLYGLAGVYSKVTFGIAVEDNGNIKYVKTGSSAEEAGLKEGMQLLSINGVYYQNNNILQQEVGSKNPGDIITIEYLDHSKEKRKATITLRSR
jgi:predicted metalloprotease with PDZ domain